MPPRCADCGHAWQAHFNRERLKEIPCTECEDLAYFDDVQPLQVCFGYVPETVAVA